MPRKEYHHPRVSNEVYYQPFIDAAHRIAINLFGPRYHEYLKKTNEGEILRRILLHIIDEDYRSKTNLKKPIDVELVNTLQGRRKLYVPQPDQYYSPYVRDKETGYYQVPHSIPFATRAPKSWAEYPIKTFFQLLQMNTTDETLRKKLTTLTKYSLFIDAFLPYPEDYTDSPSQSRPLLEKLLQELPNLPEHPFHLFHKDNYNKHKHLIDMLEEHGKTRAPHQSLTTALALLSGLTKNLQAISQNSNKLDHLHRAGILPDVINYLQHHPIRSERDIYKTILSHPEWTERITTTKAPHTSLATALALLSGLTKNLQAISQNSNKLDHLHRAGILPDVINYLQHHPIKSERDIYRTILSHPDWVEKISKVKKISRPGTIDAPHQSLAVSLAILSGLTKNIQTISQYSNTLDHLVRLTATHIDNLTKEQILREVEEHRRKRRQTEIVLDLDSGEIFEEPIKTEELSPFMGFIYWLRQRRRLSKSTVIEQAQRIVNNICGFDEECHYRILHHILDSALRLRDSPPITGPGRRAGRRGKRRSNLPPG